MLTDTDILKELMDKHLIIHPILSLGQINGTKVDLRLGNSIYVIKRLEQPVYDPRDKKIGETEIGDEVSIPIGPTGFILHPGDFALAPLFERLSMPTDLVGRLDGRSSLGRLGVIVHATAGTIDPGFSGRIICELSNLGSVPVPLIPLMRIASVSFEKLVGQVARPYSKKPRSKYAQVIYTKLSQDYEFKEGFLEEMQKFI